MPIKEIKYKKDGDPLKIKIEVINGVIAMAYHIKLSEKDSNNTVVVFDGDNQNPADDEFYLPMPLEENDDRMIRISADFIGLDLNMSDEYKIKITLFQGNKELDNIDAEGELNETAQHILHFIKLKVEENE